MEKLKSSIAAKIAAAAVFIICFCVFCVSAAGIALMDEEGVYQLSQQDAKKSLYESICDKYSIVALSGYEDDFQMQTLSGTNFRYGVIKADNIEKIDLSAPDSYLTHNFEKMPKKDEVHIYEQAISKNAEFSYGEDFWDNFYIGNVLTDENYEIERLPMDGYYYDRTIDELYIRSGNKLFPVFIESVYASGELWGEYVIDELCLKKGKSGNYIWDDSFTGVTLEYGVTDFVPASQIKIVNDAAMAKLGKIVDIADYEVNSIERSKIEILKYVEVPTDTYYVVSYVQEPLKGKQTIFGGDMFVQAKVFVHLVYKMRYPLIWIVFISFALLAASFAFLMCAAGYHRGQGGISRRFLDKIPLDIGFAATCIIECMLAALFISVFSSATTVSDLLRVSIWIMFAFAAVAGILSALVYCMGFAVNVKLGKWWQRTLSYWVLAKCWRFMRACWHTGLCAMKALWKSLSLLWKAWVLIGVAAFIELFFVASAAFDAGALVTFCVLKYLFLCPVIIFTLLQMNRLHKGAQKIANGEVNYHVDTRRMFLEMKKHGEYLNDIGIGMNRAVSERLKSERFKTELITNVSHDIKTPLTSIINYVDLLQKEQIDNEAAQEYLDVLNRQSARLKKLIEDLIEASKASSGSLNVTWEQCDMGVILVQTAGEFEEKLMENQIQLQMRNPEKNIYIKADSRHLWRVFDNLMNNICKYAQPSTRAYVDIVQEQGQVEVIFRNISKYPLNISSEELMERFVRGDSSRNSEGSGLGLSIAKSLTELMNGTFTLVVDGDLFKVILAFPAM